MRWGKNMNLKDRWKKQQAEELSRLLEWAGSRTTLATFLGVAPQVVSGWAARGRISSAGAEKVEQLTGGEFKKCELRPDINNWRYGK